MDSMIMFNKSEDLMWLPFYVTSIGYWEHQTETIRPSGFPDFQLHQILSGQGKLMVHDVEYIVGPGDVFFLFPDVPHRYTPISDRWELAWVSFNGREASRMLSYAGVSESSVSRLKDDQFLSPLKDMLLLDDQGDADIDIERSKLLFPLLLDLGRQLLVPSGQDTDRERLRPVLRYIDQNLHRSLLLRELADIAHVSPQYLCRLFQSNLKLRPMAYVNQERINRSKKLLFNERRRIYEIAKMVGFDNPSYYCAVFKRHTGMSPEEFKILHGMRS